MKKFLAPALAMTILSGTANAIDFRAQTVGVRPVRETYSYAADKRFYVAGFYNGVLTNDANDINGKFSNSFDIAAGVRATDNFRIELNYHTLDLKYDAFELEGNTFFINAIIDGRMNQRYSLLRRQVVVPYIGLGAGFSGNRISGTDAELGREFSPVIAALAGIAFEINKTFSIEFGYRYLHVISPQITIAGDDIDMSPSAHQFRTGVKLSF